MHLLDLDDNLEIVKVEIQEVFHSANLGHQYAVNSGLTMTIAESNYLKHFDSRNC